MGDGIYHCAVTVNCIPVIMHVVYAFWLYLNILKAWSLCFLVILKYSKKSCSIQSIVFFFITNAFWVKLLLLSQPDN